jgi:hypothetical protein
MAAEGFSAIIDESGSNRPLNDPTSGFGVGAILYTESYQKELVRVANRIAAITKNNDFKYKHVQQCTEARKEFIRALNLDRKRVRCYAFYTSGASVAEEIDKTRQAAKYYGDDQFSNETNEVNKTTKELLTRYINTMAPHLAAYSITRGLHIDVYWDRRSDLSLIEIIWNAVMARQNNIPQFSGVEKLVTFKGYATNDLSHIARLAGVIAGDVRQYFIVHGHRIWKHMDQNGLPQSVDPYRKKGVFSRDTMKEVAKKREMLADKEAGEASKNTVMLQGYYKSFLEDELDGYKLISFGDPNGHLGHLKINHGNDWSIIQLPD